MTRQELNALASSYKRAGDNIHDAIRDSVRKAGGFVNCSNNRKERKDMEAVVYSSGKGYSETFPIRAMRTNAQGEVEVYIGTFGTVYTDGYLRGKMSEDHWMRLKDSNVLFYQTILSIAGAIDQYIPEPRYGTVIFDLDGTLLDTLQDLGEAVNQALAARGFPSHSKKEYRGMVGHGVRNLVKSALPAEKQEDDALVDECLADFKAYYTAHIDVFTKPYPGMQKLVKELHDKGVKLAVASNKFQAGAEKLVAEFFPGIPFAAVLGDREGFPLKPDPEIVAEVLRRTGTPKKEAVLVGDSLTDMKTAANGGISAIAVRWGYRDMKATEDYPAVGSPEELLKIL